MVYFSPVTGLLKAPPSYTNLIAAVRSVLCFLRLGKVLGSVDGLSMSFSMRCSLGSFFIAVAASGCLVGSTSNKVEALIKSASILPPSSYFSLKLIQAGVFSASSRIICTRMPAISSTALLITFRLLILSPAIRVISSVVKARNTSFNLVTFMAP